MIPPPMKRAGSDTKSGPRLGDSLLALPAVPMPEAPEPVRRGRQDSVGKRGAAHPEGGSPVSAGGGGWGAQQRSELEDPSLC